MSADDPVAKLGLRAGASADDIRAARRRLAKAHHPDQGGDAGYMQAINEAADAALLSLDVEEITATHSTAEDPVAGDPVVPTRSRRGDDLSGYARDIPSFTVEALPVETFEAMVVVASWLGEVLDDDPPYRLETYLYEPLDCWCRLDVVPDAGASTVSLTIGGIDGAPAPDVLTVRDAWVSNLNAIDWPDP
jgi:hypothetical protein